MGLNYHLGGLGTVREIDKLDDITYCGKFAKLRWKKKTLFKLFLAATCVWWWYQHLCVDSFKVVLSNKILNT